MIEVVKKVDDLLSDWAITDEVADQLTLIVNKHRLLGGIFFNDIAIETAMTQEKSNESQSND